MQPFAALRTVDVGPLRYAGRAWLVAVIPSLALFAIRVATGSATLGGPLPPGWPGFGAWSIVGAPLVETALMMPLAYALRALPVRGDGPRIVALATLAALAHGLGGSAWQVAAAFWPFVVYGTAYFAWWPRSRHEAYLVTAFVHLLYNATFFAVGVGGSLLLGG